MEQLVSEDQLRLNVLLAQSLQAVRIDEAKMEVHALSDKGDAAISLHPNCRQERYIRYVRQLISSHVLGSPGGYPVYLKRWTRMGQARTESLEKLLLLGEPEAVVAVVHAQGLTDELARRAWWCENNAEHARKMLASPAVAQGSMGPVLAEFLLEFLPFEETTAAMIETVRLVLQPGLISDADRDDLWARAKRRNTYYVGFLWHPEIDLPAQQQAHPKLGDLQEVVTGGDETLSRLQTKLQQVWSKAGQNFILTALQVLKKPNDQDVVVQLFAAIQQYFACGEEVTPYSDIDRLEMDVNQRISVLMAAMDNRPHGVGQLDAYLEAILFLSGLSESLLDPVFGVTDAIGSVMRKRIAHLTTPIRQRLELLMD